MVRAAEQTDDPDALTAPLMVTAPAPEPEGRSSAQAHSDKELQGHDTPWRSGDRSHSPFADAGANDARGGYGNFLATTMSLSKAMLGTGMLVIPKAFQKLGVGPAAALLTLVGCMAWFTIAGMLEAADKTGKDTYASCVRAVCGKPAKWGIMFAVICNCLGQCVALLIVFSDILIGSSTEPGGVLQDCMPQLPLDSPLMGRRVVLAMLLLLLLPLALRRHLASLKGLNGVGMAAVVAFAVSTSIVAAAATHRGEASSLEWLPDWSSLGSGALGVVLGCIGILPVLLSADCCHQQIFPTMAMLKPYHQDRFKKVVALQYILCNTLYTQIAITSIIAFGARLQDDALANLSPASLEPLIGKPSALGMSLVVRLSYFISLIGSFIMQLYPLRQCVLEVLLGPGFKQDPNAAELGSHKSTMLGSLLSVPQAEDLLEEGHAHVQAPRSFWSAEVLFTPVTLVLLGISYTLAVLIPSIWSAISLIGSLCATLLALILPGLVMVMMEATPSWRSTAKKAAASIVVLLGCILFIDGLFSLAH